MYLKTPLLNGAEEILVSSVADHIQICQKLIVLGVRHSAQESFSNIDVSVGVSISTSISVSTGVSATRASALALVLASTLALVMVLVLVSVLALTST